MSSRTSLARRFLRHVLAPLTDVLQGLERVLAGRAARLAWVFVGLLLGWWVYVPVHELLHVAGCVLTGGEVTRLELDPIYGSRWLARWFPWIDPRGDYAGRLAEFDVRGKDSIYLATDLAPFVLAWWPGCWLVRVAVRAGSAWGFGAALPMALSPWLSWSGDAYEIGSLVVVQLPGFRESRDVLIGDDLGLRFEALRSIPEAPWVGFGLAVFVGTVWAALTAAFGSWLASRWGQLPLEANSRSARSAETSIAFWRRSAP